MKRSFTYLLLLGSAFYMSGCTKKRPGQEEPIPKINIPYAQPADGTPVTSSKTVYVPKNIWAVELTNDYDDNNSEYSNIRKVETNNFVYFWAKLYGNDVSGVPNFVLASDELERFYKYYQDNLKFVDKGNSLTDKYKMLVFLRNVADQTAYGGGAADSVGVLWLPTTRLQETPASTFAHELGHSFQYMVHANGDWGFSSNPTGGKGQAIYEMTSQWMLWQVYPNWMTIENYHVVNFMANTHMAFMHEDMRYASPFVLQYWADKHGIDFIAKIWRQATRGEDPIATYKRLNNITQTQFNNEMFDAARRFVTWDIALIKPTEGAKYANTHATDLNAKGDGWYQITPGKAPQNYGYNAIKLTVPAAGTKVTVDFKGLTNVPGYRAVQTDKAGWRYGFVAYKNDGNRVYSNVYANAQGTGEITVPADTKFLWLVVSGAPTQHWEHIWDDDVNTDEQWPYQVKLTGTSIDPAMIK